MMSLIELIGKRLSGVVCGTESDLEGSSRRSVMATWKTGQLLVSRPFSRIAAAPAMAGHDLRHPVPEL